MKNFDSVSPVQVAAAPPRGKDAQRLSNLLGGVLHDPGAQPMAAQGTYTHWDITPGTRACRSTQPAWPDQHCPHLCINRLVPPRAQRLIATFIPATITVDQRGYLTGTPITPAYAEGGWARDAPSLRKYRCNRYRIRRSLDWQKPRAGSPPPGAHCQPFPPLVYFTTEGPRPSQQNCLAFRARVEL
jgi:hypothetical protein